jgi:hypothetical protein
MISRIPRFIGIFFLTLLLLGVGWVWLTLHWSYAEGERAGYVQKMSKKGWLCKTWEGEIVMVSMPGAIPEKFAFTVREDFMADKINALAGQRVVLRYQQHRYIPFSCFGETEYFVEAVRSIQAESAPLPVPSVQQGKLQTPR